MTDYKRLVIKKYPRIETGYTNEYYWKKFKNPILVKEHGPINSIYFSQVEPHNFAVTSSARVQIYSPVSNTVKKTISRFTDIAYSGHIRSDGQLLVAGDATGLIQMFDLNSRAILRTFREHSKPVHVTKFSSNKTQILSASDDKTVKLLDIPGQSILNNFDEHKDYVRSALVSQDNSNIILSGSYDHTVKLWDARENKCTLTFDHGAPVESVLLYPGGSLAVSVGGNYMKIWDILAGGRTLHTISNHQKTITSAIFDNSCTKILTGSLDHHVKIYDIQNFNVEHSLKYESPILSLGLSPDDTHLVVGMASGLLSIRQRIVHSEEMAFEKENTAPFPGTYNYFMRGATTKPKHTDLKVEKNRRTKLKNYDRFLKTFRYGQALDAVLDSSKTYNTAVVISMLEELINREGLRIALSGRDDVSLEPITKFIMKNIINPNYTELLVDVTNVILGNNNYYYYMLLVNL
jgi:U3 small nucleolar RNA-associated protein 15